MDEQGGEMHRTSAIGIGLFIILFLLIGNAAAGTRDNCVVKCKEAAAFIKNDGIQAAIEEIGKRHNRFTWNDGVSYVFLMNMDCKMLAHPVRPEMTQSTQLINQTDVNGKAMFKDFIDAAKKGKGWTKYDWTVPGHDVIKPKHTFIYRVPDTDYFVGAGFYVMEPGVFY